MRWGWGRMEGEVGRRLGGITRDGGIIRVWSGVKRPGK